MTRDDCDDNDSSTVGDMDCDGYPTSNDCDDTDSAINPGASDTFMDGIDQNCDSADGPQGQMLLVQWTRYQTAMEIVLRLIGTVTAGVILGLDSE